jgi:alcohol-forming fatty acyl-CoA reductase
MGEGTDHICGVAPASDRCTRSAAFFDVDGTIVDSTIVHYYMYFRRRLCGPLYGRLWRGAYLCKCLYYLVLDRINRSRFNRAFYKDYAGLRVNDLNELADDCYRDVIAPRLFPEAVACIDEHRRAGRSVVLVTGSLDFIMAPLARSLKVDDMIVAAMTEHQGVLTGELTSVPIGEEEKARRMRAYAEEHDIDLSQSYAYGDSTADVPMLECVGHPCAINPKKKLRRIAHERGWSIHEWSRDALEPKRNDSFQEHVHSGAGEA